MPSCDVLLTNATVLTMDEEFRVFESGVVAVTGDRIVAVGEGRLAGEFTAGQHVDCGGQVLMPGLIIGRIPLGGRNNLIVGAGYQFAVTDNPVTKNNWAITTRITF